MILKRKTVLVIEDNEMNMKLVRALAQIGQYDILEAVDAESGLPLARAHKPHLIFMDVQLRGMDGLSSTRIIEEDPALKHIPVIALTSYAMQGDAKKALEAGCDRHVTKPIDTRAFLDTIRKFLQGSREKTQVFVDDIYPRLL